MTVNVIAAGLLTAPAVVGSAWHVLRGDHGLAPDPASRRINGDMMVAPVPGSLRSPDAPASATLRFVRPAILDDQPSRPEQPTRRGLVYVTLGTVFHLESGDLFARLVQATNLLATTDDVDVLVSTGGAHLSTDGVPSPGPRVRIESFVPQREVIGRCRAVVCHAGSGTILDALALGIPVVALPLGAAQPDNADRCQELGVGVCLHAVSVAADRIADAVTAVLHDPSFTDAARIVAAEARGQPRLHDHAPLRELLAR